MAVGSSVTEDCASATPNAGTTTADELRSGRCSVWGESALGLFKTGHALDYGTVWMDDGCPQAVEITHDSAKEVKTGEDQLMTPLEQYMPESHLMIDLSKDLSGHA